MRQEEAAFLSKSCDAMVVVGDARSSNTGRLAMICKENCPKVVLVDHADELDMTFFPWRSYCGYNGGASTPPWIIKEVNNKMSEELKVETAQEENFAELLEQSLKTLNNGDKVTGTVMAIGSTEIEVDLGTKHTAYIPLEDFSGDPSVKPEGRRARRRPDRSDRRPCQRRRRRRPPVPQASRGRQGLGRDRSGR